jgi:hypothetical protein
VDFNSLPQGLSKILEISIARHVGRDKQEIVVIGGSEPSDAPVQTGFRSPVSDAGLECPGEDLLERRIAGQRIRQIAWIVWIGAAKLDGGGRPPAFRITGVQIHEPGRAEGDAGGWVESVEHVPSVERARAAARIDAVAVIQLDLHVPDDALKVYFPTGFTPNIASPPFLAAFFSASESTRLGCCAKVTQAKAATVAIEKYFTAFC